MKHIKIQKFHIAATALLLLALLLGYCLSMTAGHGKAPDVVILGDSIMGKERAIITIGEGIEAQTGLTVFNGAFGGSCASAGNADNRYSYHEESLNLYSLTDAITQRDFGVQLADLPDNQFQSDYFSEALKGLSQIDFNKVDVLLIEHAFNDYSGGRALDNPADSLDITTYGGALRYSLEKLRDEYPSLRIVMVTAAYCWIPDYDVCTRQDFGHGTLTDFVNLQLQIAEDYGLDVIDVYNQAGFTEENIRSYTEDGIHLNEDGRTLYGNFIGTKLNIIIRRDPS